MNIMIIHAHSANRGDEAAVKAMVDEIRDKMPTANFVISINGLTKYPSFSGVKQIDRLPKIHSIIAKIDFKLITLSNGKISITKHGREYIDCIKNADLVIHAPGGPALGDIYYEDELLYLKRLMLVKKLGKKYMFYAPSMGPFLTDDKKRNKLRKEILCGAEKIFLRDPISIQYLKEYLPAIEVEHAMDSALQHDISIPDNEKILEEYLELSDFLGKHEKIIGITITDLLWHPKHKNNPAISNIKSVFNEFIEERIANGYGILFIPQLYGSGNDHALMSQYMKKENTFIMEANNEKYDTYFQQFIVGKLYAVVGMRYHSNIFSAKMGTPFVSISYEQKMSGFMKSIQLYDYCIEIDDLNFEVLREKFAKLEDNYNELRNKLENLHSEMKEKSYKSTKAVLDILEEKS